MGADPHGRFVEIYEHAYEPILGYVLRRCRDPEDAADVVAETFTIAWRRVEELPDGDEARLWLYGVARRVLANHRRGELRREQRTEALRELASTCRAAPPSATPTRPSPSRRPRTTSASPSPTPRPTHGVSRRRSARSA